MFFLLCALLILLFIPEGMLAREILDRIPLSTIREDAGASPPDLQMLLFSITLLLLGSLLARVIRHADPAVTMRRVMDVQIASSLGLTVGFFVSSLPLCEGDLSIRLVQVVLANASLVCFFGGTLASALTQNPMAAR